MPSIAVNKTIEQLRRAVLAPDGAGLSDGRLLTCFVEHRDDSAFEALVRRLGPMVLGVCRRVMENDQDAEDAFQATFLVLVRKAAMVVPREAVANWLYGVAYQTARKGRAMAVKRRIREKQVTAMPELASRGASAAGPDPEWSDLLPLLDQELARLPDKYRLPVVLCDLQGRTRKDAAGQLGWPEGSLSGRLSRARGILARRLSRRGVVISGGALAAVIGQNAASAFVPPAVLAATLHAAKAFAAGSVASAISIQAAALAEGVLKTMLIAKLKTGALMLVTCGLIALGGSLAYSGFGSQPGGDRGAGELPALQKAAPQEKLPQTLIGQPASKREQIELERLQGAWESVSTIRNSEASGTIKFVIEKDNIRYPDSELADRIVALRPTSPRQIDLEVLSGPLKGNSFLGIYKLEGDELTICHGKNRPTAFASPKGSGHSLIVLRRQKTAGADGAGDKTGQQQLKPLVLTAEVATWEGRPYIKVYLANPNDKALEMTDTIRPSFKIQNLCAVKVDGKRATLMSQGAFSAVGASSLEKGVPVESKKELPAESKLLLGVIALDRDVAEHFGASYTPVLSVPDNEIEPKTLRILPGKHTVEIARSKLVRFPADVTPAKIEVEVPPWPPSGGGADKTTTPKAASPPEGNYIKAEVRGIVCLDARNPAGGYVQVRRDDRGEDKVWFWFNEGEWKRWRDAFPKLAGVEVVVRGRIAQMPQKSVASVPPGALYFVGAIEIESPPRTPR
jgi:RNA polymerase sigma factor (sigma-70 family)